MLSGIAVVLGVCTRYAALGAAVMLGIGAYALFVVKGFGRVRSKGGFEYPMGVSAKTRPTFAVTSIDSIG